MSTTNITVLTVESKHVPTDKGGYQQIEVTYKGPDGKLASKKLVSFGKGQKAAKALAEAKQGDSFTIEQEKNDKGYWDWLNASQAAPGTQFLPQEGKSSGTPVKSNYETAEERAKRQVMIVKQSSLAQAVALLSVGAKQPPSRDLVLQEAQAFVDWILAEPKVSLAEMPNDFPDVQ